MLSLIVVLSCTRTITKLWVLSFFRTIKTYSARSYLPQPVLTRSTSGACSLNCCATIYAVLLHFILQLVGGEGVEPSLGADLTRATSYKLAVLPLN